VIRDLDTPPHCLSVVTERQTPASPPAAMELPVEVRDDIVVDVDQRDSLAGPAPPFMLPHRPIGAARRRGSLRAVILAGGRQSSRDSANTSSDTRKGVPTEVGLTGKLTAARAAAGPFGPTRRQTPSTQGVARKAPASEVQFVGSLPVTA
jgi:hypothetical protein